MLDAASRELESASELRAGAIQESIALRTATEREVTAIRGDAQREADDLVRRAQAELQAAMDLEAAVEEAHRQG